MEPEQVIRILPNGEQELALATDLRVDDPFIDETRKWEAIVVEVGEG
jgi:hypothetical protein